MILLINSRYEKKYHLGFCFNDLLQAECTTTMALYEDEILNSKPSINKESAEINEDGLYIISHISVPSLTVYKPAKQSRQKSAVIICPGGGYRIVAAKHEGSDAAKVLSNSSAFYFPIMKHISTYLNIAQEKKGLRYFLI